LYCLFYSQSSPESCFILWFVILRSFPVLSDYRTDLFFSWACRPGASPCHLTPLAPTIFCSRRTALLLLSLCFFLMTGRGHGTSPFVSFPQPRSGLLLHFWSFCCARMTWLPGIPKFDGNWGRTHSLFSASLPIFPFWGLDRRG